MSEHVYRLGAHVRVTFGLPHGTVRIEKAGDRLTLSADEWDAIIDRSPYMRQLAERYPPGV